MYIILIGPSGVRKGTAMNPGLDLLEDIGLPVASEAITREALIREMSEQTTIDYDLDGQQIVHTSLTIHSEELTVFLGYENMQLITDLCDWYDCRRRWKYRTKGQGTDELVNMWLNIQGATTPDTLHAALPPTAIGAGLTSRMIFVYEEERGKWIPDPFLSEEEKHIRIQLRDDLESILMMKGRFRISSDFLAHWINWYHSLKGIRIPDPKLAGYYSRRPAHILKLCMIMSASRSDDMIITIPDFERALHYLVFTEQKMPRVFSGMGTNLAAKHIRQIMGVIAVEKQIKLSKLMFQFHFDVDIFTMKQILQTLVLENFIKQDPIAGQDDYLLTYTGRYSEDGEQRGQDSIGLFSPAGNLIGGPSDGGKK